MARYVIHIDVYGDDLLTRVVTHLMARCLETQANHMRIRAEASVAQRMQ
jgi:hypothetical protein